MHIHVKNFPRYEWLGSASTTSFLRAQLRLKVTHWLYESARRLVSVDICDIFHHLHTYINYSWLVFEVLFSAVVHSLTMIPIKPFFTVACVINLNEYEKWLTYSNIYGLIFIPQRYHRKFSISKYHYVVSLHNSVKFCMKYQPPLGKCKSFVNFCIR